MKNLHTLNLPVTFAICAALILCLAIPASAQRTYTVTDLGSVAGAFETNASDINNRGQATVISFLSFFPVFESIGFVSKDGNMTLLPSLGGQFTFASAINDSGIVVGSANFAGDTITHAVIWDRDLLHVTDLGTLGGATSSAVWLNARLHVVGDSVIANGTDTHAFLWDKGKLTDLGTLGGSTSFAFVINDGGQIVGQSDITVALDPTFGIPQFHGFVWVRGAMKDLGDIFGGHFNYANSVNDRGEIVGAADLTGDLTGHAFMIQAGTLNDLGTVPGDTNSAAFSVNSRGQVVGTSSLSFSPPFGPPVLNFQCPCHAAIWEDGMVTDLNTLIPAGSGWQLLDALAINDRGQIVGDGTLNNGLSYRAFLLTPQDGDSSSTTTSAAHANAAAGSSQTTSASSPAMHITIINGKPRIVVEHQASGASWFRII
jgi:probable HAF family extracellular repeat protein